MTAGATSTDINGRTRPPPSVDPTTATLDVMYREIANLEKELANRVEHLATLIDEKLSGVGERLNGIDEATKLRLSGIEGIPGQIDEKVGHLQSLADEKFASVAKQFEERDTRSERESRDNKVAVDAAFAAQKEAAAKQDEGNQKAIDKSEAATAEKIAKLNELFTVAIAALGDKVDDLKDRVGRMEAIKQGGTETRSGLFGAIAAFGTVVVVGIAIVTFIVTH
jgi:cation transport regulator ChaB